MKLDPIYALTLISVAFNVYQGIKKNNKQDASLLTTLMVKLETIGTVMNEIKNELGHTKEDLQENRERIIKVEEKSTSAHKRLDCIEKKLGKVIKND